MGRKDHAVYKYKPNADLITPENSLNLSREDKGILGLLLRTIPSTAYSITISNLSSSPVTAGSANPAF